MSRIVGVVLVIWLVGTVGYACDDGNPAPGTHSPGWDCEYVDAGDHAVLVCP